MKIFVAIVLCEIILVIFNACEKPVTVPPPDAPPPNGYVFIDSYPRGMNIFIEGKDRQRITPDSITWLKEKEYIFTLKHSYFRDTSFSLYINENKKESLFVDFRLNRKMLSKLELSSYPQGASIFINDSMFTEKTPAVFENLLPGSYKIRYSLPNHRDAETIVLLTSGKTTSAFLPLLDLLTWREYKAENSDLTTNKLKCISKNMNGEIWFGTEDHGIYKYDGNSFTNYSRNNSPVLCNDINEICFNSFGTMFIATAEMAIVVYPERIFGQNKNHEWLFWSVEDTLTTLPDNYVTSIAIKENNEFWFGTKNGLMSVFPEGGLYVTRTFNTANSELPQNYITDVKFFGSQLWVATKSEGFLIFTDNIWERFATFNTELRSNNVSKILPIAINKAYLGLNTNSDFTPGFSLFDNGTILGDYYDMPDNNVKSIFVDSKSRTWIGTEKSVIVFKNWDNKTVYTFENTALDIVNISGFVEDVNGNILIVSNGGGLFRYLK